MDSNWQALAVGCEIAGYRIVRVLGAGGFGLTYEAINALERRFAVKEFFPSGLASREGATRVIYRPGQDRVIAWALDRFERSTVELGRLRHRNIVEVFHYLKENGTGYMVMEYVEGSTLESWLQERAALPSPAELRPVLEPIFDAIGYMHQRDLLHRDIAPDNIMIRADGRPVLIDFGAMKMIEQRTTAVAGSSYAVAKAHYSPPEQTQEGARLAPAADVYSLGAVLYRAFAGKAPADGEARKHGVALEGADPYVPLASLQQLRLPANVVASVDRALALRARERFQTVSELLAGLGWGSEEVATTTAAARPQVDASTGKEAKTTLADHAGRGGLPSEIEAGPVSMASGPSAAHVDSAFSDDRRRRRSVVGNVGFAAVALILVGAFTLPVKEWLGREAPPRPPTAPVPDSGPGTPPPLEAFPSTPTPPPRTDPIPAPVRPSARAPTPLTAAQERALKPRDSFKECDICPEMVIVPAGAFTMGSPTSEPDRSSNEGLQRQVTVLRPLAVGRFAVTFDEWDACVADGGCNRYRPSDGGWGRSRRPVINVSWDDAKAYVAWLSRKTGRNYRLLSEAEREYATRAGTTTPFWWGPSISKSQANYDGNARGTVPVDSFAPNPWGLYQVHGNVYDWVEDCWNDSYKGAPTDGSAWRAGDCGHPVLRGGSWNLASAFLRSAYRYSNSSGFRGFNFGLRVARTLSP